ncbi:MAG: HAD family phosphatase [Thermodesulfobacteriota bacterium]
MIEHVIFDLGQVLVPFDWQIAIRRLASHVSPEVRALINGNKAAFVSLVEGPATALETGRIDFDTFQSEVQPQLGTNLDPAEFHDIWCDIFDVNPEMIALGKALSSRMGTWLASNTSEAHFQWILRRFPEVGFYRKAALSYELGVMKPNPAFFRMALKTFAIDPRKAVFTDDIEENVLAAVAEGMAGIHFRSRDQLVRELNALGVHIG